MKIKDMQIKELKIPFKMGFKHAGAERKTTQTVIVKVISGSGAVGWGEGCPREYVTGESLNTCKKYFESVKEDLLQIGSLPQLQNWVKENKKDIDMNPAAWCAAELALLDVIGREDGKNVEEVLGLKSPGSEFKYTAVLGDSPPLVYRSQVEKFLGYGFKDFKIKISGDVSVDRQKLNDITDRAMGHVRLRLDGNNLWRTPEKVVEYLESLKHSLFALEEPLAVGNYHGMRTIAGKYPLKIILDESFLRREQIHEIEKDPATFIINIRISKMGGVLRSLDVARSAAEKGIPIIVGAQVGETSILTRAAMTVAQNFEDSLAAQEGAYGTLLLERDVIDNPLMFGAGGVLKPECFLENAAAGWEFDVFQIF